MTKQIDNPTRGGLPYRPADIAGTATTGSYANLLLMWIRDCDYITIFLHETGGANAALYSIDVSHDGTVWHNKKTDVNLAADGEAIETMSELWAWIRVQIKDAAAPNHATVAADALARKIS